MRTACAWLLSLVLLIGSLCSWIWVFDRFGIWGMLLLVLVIALDIFFLVLHYKKKHKI